MISSPSFRLSFHFLPTPTKLTINAKFPVIIQSWLKPLFHFLLVETVKECMSVFTNPARCCVTHPCPTQISCTADQYSLLATHIFPQPLNHASHHMSAETCGCLSQEGSTRKSFHIFPLFTCKDWKMPRASTGFLLKAEEGLHVEGGQEKRAVKGRCSTWKYGEGQLPTAWEELKEALFLF